ncbi:MAG: protease modulator HflC [Bacteriovoracales bacterium]|nr:protease modulator HflC [Bacteriovoracales bacterium]
MTKNITLLVIAALFLFLNASLFVLNEHQQAIITQFGKPVGKPITKAGLHFKLPIVQEVRYVDKRILNWDGDPNQLTTRDKKFIGVDTTARWKIVDALKFIQTVQNEHGARSRLDAVLDAKTRETISSHNLVEAVRNTNSIFNELESRKESAKAADVEEEVVGEIEKVSVGREKISQIIVEKASSELRNLGIELVDVQLRRISYEKSVEQKVYERMISERKRIAEKIRSIGQGEKAKIEGRLAQDLQLIESKSYRTSQEIKGKAEAKAIQIYAASLKRGPKFYEFLKTMEAYEKTFGKQGKKAKFILSSDAKFLKYLD